MTSVAKGNLSRNLVSQPASSAESVRMQLVLSIRSMRPAAGGERSRGQPSRPGEGVDERRSGGRRRRPAGWSRAVLRGPLASGVVTSVWLGV